MICIAETIASAAGVLNNVDVVTTGAGPRIRPSWFMRSAARAVNASVEVSKTVMAPHQTLLPDGFILFSMMIFAETLGEALRLLSAAIFAPTLRAFREGM
jgi:hypothetical protein